MNLLNLACIKATDRETNSVSFIVCTTTNLMGAIMLLEASGYINVDIIYVIKLEEEYSKEMTMYIFTQDQHLHKLFTLYRDEIDEHYGRQGIVFEEQYQLFQDEFGLDI